MIDRNFILMLLIHIVLISCATSIKSQSEPKEIISLHAVLTKVKQYHPISKKADLQVDKSNADLLKAKGSFDPKISFDLNQKNYGNAEYYSLLNGSLKVPTWIGAEIKTGFEMNRGLFLSPENNTPNNGLFYAGISMPLGQGLIIDERRTGFKLARISQESAVANRKDILNELLFNGVITYMNWFRSYHVKNIFEISMINANQRYLAVKTNAVQGERPFIDTTEAKIQLQNIGLSLNQADLEYNNFAILLSGFFWDENYRNSGFSPLVAPDSLESVSRLTSQNINITDPANFVSDHPYLKQLSYKITQFDLEGKLKRDKLKPRLNVQYNPLIQPVGSNIFTNYNINNYKWGLEFNMPIFLRKERGDIRLNDYKISETRLELNNKSTELYNKYKTYVNEYYATRDQIKLYMETVNLYEKMLNAEQNLFRNGESSLFLVNTREQAYINAKIKLVELISKNIISYYTILYFSGTLADL